MKVKELIEKLRILDQEKEIKIVIVSGYEYEESTCLDIDIDKYSDTAETNVNGETYFPIDDDGEDNDFYLIH
jgi:hypothetical protein